MAQAGGIKRLIRPGQGSAGAALLQARAGPVLCARHPADVCASLPASGNEMFLDPVEGVSVLLAIAAPFGFVQIFPVFLPAGMPAHIAPRLRYAVEMDDPRAAADLAQLSRGYAERVVIDKEGRDDIPDICQRQPAIVEARVQNILIDIDNLLGIGRNISKEAIEYAFRPPALQIDQQYSGVEIPVTLGDPQRRAAVGTRNRDGADYPFGDIGVPQFTDIAHYYHVAIKI